jgi:hypothetical protein
VLAELTTNQKGLVAETAIIHEAVKLGIVVARPLDDVPYDLILDFGTALVRVQCKWAVRKGDVVIVPTRRCRRGPEGFIHRGYELGEIDAVAAYCAELQKCYLLPLSMSVGRAAVQLRLRAPRNNQQRGINWARDFEFGATLPSLGPIAQLGERVAGSDEVVGSSPTGSIPPIHPLIHTTREPRAEP